MAGRGRATTHTDLVVRAKKKLGVEVKVIHNASVVMNAVGVCGLQLYHYGSSLTHGGDLTVSMKRLKSNRTLGLHSLCLLDIRVKEPTLESLCRGKKQYEPPKYMTIATAIEQLLEVEHARRQFAYCEDTTCVGLAGSPWKRRSVGSCRLNERVTEG